MDPAITVSSDASISASSFISPSEYTNGDDGSFGDVDSLPESETDSDTISEFTDSSESDAEREWNESLRQLELLLTMVVVPWAGKYFGRLVAYKSWAKFMEWKYPVEVKITNKAMFRGAGIVGASAPL